MHIFLLVISCSLTQFANIGVISTAISQLEAIDMSGSLSSSVSVVNILGISFAGICLGSILTKLQGFRIGFWGPLVSSLLVLPMLFMNFFYVTLICVFLISINSGLENPNNNSTLNRLIVDPKQKAYIFSKYQTAIQVSIIFSPILSGILILTIGHHFSYLVFIVFYLLSCLSWLCFRSISSECKGEKKSLFLGYKLIANQRSLRDLTISRILNNFIFTGVIILIPIMAAKSSINNDHFTIIQNFAISTLGLGFVCNGFISNKILKLNPLYTIPFAKSATIIGIIGALLPIIFNYSEYSIYLMTFILGFGQFFFRLSGMTLGQAVTPTDHLGEVILASDTIVRGITAGYTMILLASVQYFASVIPFFIFCILALPAPIFLISSAQVYKAQCYG